MTRDEAIKFYIRKIHQSRSETSKETYRDILDIVKNQPNPLDVVQFRLDHATSPRKAAIFRKALRELGV